jgi:TonB family protein
MRRAIHNALLALTAAMSLGVMSSGAQPGTNVFVEPIPETTVDPAISPVTYQGGTVVVRVAVTEDGTVDSVEVVRPFPALTDAVVAAIRQWRFKPATFDGRTVAASTNVALHVALVRSIAPPAAR